jgi:hypothetical protein
MTRQWTRAEERFIADERERGRSIKEIARKLPSRTPNAIRHKAQALKAKVPPHGVARYWRRTAYAQVAAKAQLRDEIEAAKREARTAPLYKPALGGIWL